MLKIIKFIGLALALVLVAIFSLAVFVWVLGLFVAVAVVWFVAWLCGARITVKDNGKKIGYIKYTKFYSTKGY